MFIVPCYKTETFRIDDQSGFLVDIVRDTKEYHAWIYHAQYEIKMHMFSFEKRDCKNKDEFIQVVKANIPSYLEEYKQQYMD